MVKEYSSGNVYFLHLPSKQKQDLKKYLFVFLILIDLSSQHICLAQNLVPNWSFEIVNTCNFYISSNCLSGVNHGLVPPWDAPTSGSSDLYNSCSVYPDCNVPSNWIGFQNAHTGNGYVGEVFFASFTSGREYIQVQLDSILISQHKYCVNFYVSLSDSHAFATNNVALYFSNTHTDTSATNLSFLQPQIIDTNIISDTTNWTLVSGEYIAIGGEKFIIIGNFNSAATTDTLTVNGSFTSYYYIDDVSVLDCTGSGLGVDELCNNIF